MRRYENLKLHKMLLVGLLVMLVLPVMGCQGDNTNIAIPIYVHNPGAQDPATVLDSIYITPGWITVAVGDAQIYRAIAIYSDGHEAEVTGKVIWVIDGLDWTSNRGYFPTYGRLITTSAGTLTINVRFGGEIYGQATIGVFDPQIDIPPQSPKDMDYSVMTNGDIYLTWSMEPPLPSDLLGYNIYRSRKSTSGYEQLNFEPILGMYYRDEEVAGGIYYYTVTAIDLGAHESDYAYELMVDNR